MTWHVQFPDLLPPAVYADLLAYALQNRDRFEETTISVDEKATPSFRRSRRITDLGPFRPVIEAAALERSAALAQVLGLPAFEPGGVEIELVAHEHGAFYKRHIDLFPHARERERQPGDRMISLVSYLFREPRGFGGGELRMYPSPDPAAAHVDILPDHGLSVAFSSWLPHEVRPVDCPSGRFEDARFGLNCWIYRAKHGEKS